MLTELELADKYLWAKQFVIASGYEREVGWQESVLYEPLTEKRFMSEAAWVILNSGMRETVVRRLFPTIAAAFGGFATAESAMRARATGRMTSLSIFNHAGKIDAIVAVIEHLNETGLEEVENRISVEGLCYLRELPYIGPITSFHLAKNLGMDIAKPDRHLTKIATATGYCNANTLCEALSIILSEPVAVADIVLWRFATLFPNYASWFQESTFDELDALSGSALAA